MTEKDFKRIKEKFLTEQKVEKKALYSNGTVNEDAIRMAIEKAYNDAQPRLIPKHNNVKEELYNWSNEELPLGYLKKSLKEFLEGKANNKGFDVWHEEICGEFLVKYNELLKKVDNEQKIGKVQKIVNMSMKYLYCMADEDKEELFKDCHMPLDKYTFKNWFYKEANKLVDVKVLKKEVESWSNIEEYKDESDKEKHTYLWIQQKIRELLRDKERTSQYRINDRPMTALQAEFIIWQEEKWSELLLGIANLTLEKQEKGIYSNENMKKIISEAGNNVEILKEYYGIE